MSKGFTIIESVISIFVLFLGVIGAFSVFSIIAIMNSDSIDRLTATYLVQEGMEITRNMRDTNWLKKDLYEAGKINSYVPAWVDGLTDQGSPEVNCAYGQNACRADYRSSYMEQETDTDYLKINNDGFYNYADGNKTKFRRKIYITPVADITEQNQTNILNYHILKVRTEVSWDRKKNMLDPAFQAGQCDPRNCIVAEETLYNWYNTNVMATEIKFDEIDNYECQEGQIVGLSIAGNQYPSTYELIAKISPSYASDLSVFWSAIENGQESQSVTIEGDDQAIVDEETGEAIARATIIAEGQTSYMEVKVSTRNGKTASCFFQISE